MFTLTAADVLQPDILFISGARKAIIGEVRIDGPCNLIIEIMSPANRRKDRLQKMGIYRKGGIAHYWFAENEDNTLEAFMLKESHYAHVVAGGSGDKFTHPAFPGLEPDMDRVYRHPELKRPG